MACQYNNCNEDSGSTISGTTISNFDENCAPAACNPCGDYNNYSESSDGNNLANKFRDLFKHQDSCDSSKYECGPKMKKCYYKQYYQCRVPVKKTIKVPVQVPTTKKQVVCSQVQCFKTKWQKVKVPYMKTVKKTIKVPSCKTVMQKKQICTYKMVTKCRKIPYVRCEPQVSCEQPCEIPMGCDMGACQIQVDGGCKL